MLNNAFEAGESSNLALNNLLVIGACDCEV